MNRRLLDPFQTVALPEIVEEILQRGTATCAEFNPWGTLLAAGGSMGEVIVWDFETKGVARASQPHDQDVACLAWTRDGRHLVSASADCTISSLSVLDNKQVAKMKLHGEPVALCISRPNPSQVLVSFREGPPALLDLSQNSSTPVPCVPSDNDAKKTSRSTLAGGQMTAAAIFSKDGRIIYVGQTRGLLSVLDAGSLQFLDVLKLPGMPRILSLQLDRKGRRLLANCSDRVIRLVDLTSPPAQQLPAPFSAEEAPARARTQPKQDNGATQQPGLLALSKEFHNSGVERKPWAAAAFSHDLEYVAGATPEHKIYAWSLHSGRLEKMLEIDGSSDGLLQISWHPQRSCFVSVGDSGKIYVWAQVYRENWSAFAPDFTELTENQEYCEREDEFDINLRSPERPADQGNCEEAELDVETAEPIEALYCSSEEDPETAPPRLHHLPLEIDRQRPSSPEPNANEDADEEDGVSLSPSEEPQPQPRAESLGPGKRRRSQARSRSRSHDVEDLPAATRQKSMDGSAQRHKNLLSGLNKLDLPTDMF